MTFDIQMRIDNQSPEGHALESIVRQQRVSPEDAIRQLLTQFNADQDNFDHLFTPEVVADLRSVAAEMEAGGTVYSGEEIREHFVQKRNTCAMG